MRYFNARLLLVAAALLVCRIGYAHDSNATITWNREISRIVYARCASCHRPDGTSFSLLTYQEVQPRAAAIKASVLSRRMPPWGAVKGFGEFRDDQSLTQEEIGLITTWIETGALKGNNPSALPSVPKFEATTPTGFRSTGIPMSGEAHLDHEIVLDGLMPDQVPDRATMQIIAARPDGSIQPLLWLYEYQDRFRHPFFFRSPIRLPAGTTIQGVPSNARFLLIPFTR